MVSSYAKWMKGSQRRVKQSRPIYVKSLDKEEWRHLYAPPGGRIISYARVSGHDLQRKSAPVKDIIFADWD